jgi:galactokinase
MEVANDPTDVNHLCKVARDAHQRQFGQTASFCVLAPGRVNLIGDHTDYNEGFVFPMAIDRFVVIAGNLIETNGPPVLNLWSVAEHDSTTIQVGERPTRTAFSWTNYAAGVAAGLFDRNHSLRSANLTVTSNLPIGAGLSSSAAFEVAIATSLERLNGFRLDPIDKALLCQRAEHEFARVPCGIMDQLASVCGRRGQALFIDCRTIEIRWVDFSDSNVSVLICNSNTSHSLASSQYASRRADCEQAARLLGRSSLRDVSYEELPKLDSVLAETLLARVRHVVTENRRVQDFAKALSAGDWEWAGRLMYESHTSLRDAYQVSCNELDWLVETARSLALERGVYGSRMTGAGFGGSTVNLVRTDCVEDIIQAIGRKYLSVANKPMTAIVARSAEGTVANS